MDEITMYNVKSVTCTLHFPSAPKSCVLAVFFVHHQQNAAVCVKISECTPSVQHQTADGQQVNAEHSVIFGS